MTKPISSPNSIVTNFSCKSCGHNTDVTIGDATIMEAEICAQCGFAIEWSNREIVGYDALFNRIWFSARTNGHEQTLSAYREYVAAKTAKARERIFYDADEIALIKEYGMKSYVQRAQWHEEVFKDEKSEKIERLVLGVTLLGDSLVLQIEEHPMLGHLERWMFNGVEVIEDQLESFVRHEVIPRSAGILMFELIEDRFDSLVELAQESPAHNVIPLLRGKPGFVRSLVKRFFT